MFDTGLLIIAGFAAGVLNAVAGGGTFLTLPALIFVGVPPVAANATATFAALPGYLSSAWAFRGNGLSGGALSLGGIVGLSACGSVVGAGALLVTTNELFSSIAPWLLLVATTVFAGGPQLMRHLQSRGIPPAGPVATRCALLAVSVYGGFFNGGLGIMLLAVLVLVGHTDIHVMNGLKVLLSAVLSLASVGAFFLADIIAWHTAAPVAGASLVGGIIGAQVSQRISDTRYLRAFVVLTGTIMTALFFSAS